MFQKKKKEEEEEEEEEEEDIMLGDSTTSDGPSSGSYVPSDSVSNPLGVGSELVSDEGTPPRTMRSVKEEEEEEEEEEEKEDRLGGEKRKKSGGFGTKKKTGEEEVSPPGSDERRKEAKAKQRKGVVDKRGDNEGGVPNEKLEEKLMAQSKSGVSKASAKSVAYAAVVPEKTMETSEKTVTKASTKTASKGDPWSRLENKAFIGIRQEAFMECLDKHSNFVNANTIPHKVQDKAERTDALIARQNVKMKDRLKTMKKSIIQPYVLGTISLKELKDKLRFDSDKDVETFVEQFQLEFALKVSGDKTIEEAEEKDKAVRDRKYGKFYHPEEKDRKKAATKFLVDRKAERNAMNEGKNEEPDIFWFKIPALKGEDNRDRFFEDIIKKGYGDVKRGVDDSRETKEVCFKLVKSECKREGGMAQVFCKAKTAQTRYAIKEVNGKDEEGKEIKETIETLDEARREAKEKCIRYVWEFYKAAGYDFEKAKYNLNVAWQMEKGDPTFDVERIPNEALNNMFLYKNTMMNVCKNEESEELKMQVFTSAAEAFKLSSADAFEYGDTAGGVDETNEYLACRDDVEAGIKGLKSRNLPISERGA